MKKISDIQAFRTILEIFKINFKYFHEVGSDVFNEKNETYQYDETISIEYTERYTLIRYWVYFRFFKGEFQELHIGGNV